MALACAMRGSAISRASAQARPGKATRVARVVCSAKRVVREVPTPKVVVELSSEVSKLITVGAVASSLFASGNALAAQELATLAASDNRGGIILTLLVPVLGWVGFNIFGPASRQLQSMSAPSSGTKRKGAAVAVGLTAASLFAADQADAATEFTQLAASDNRLGIILTLLVPVLGWVLFNILGPAQRQLQSMSSDKPGTKKKGVAAVVGLTAASMLAVQSADAAQELGQLAASDNRAGIILTLLVPVLGWVGFNIFGPASRQLQSMSSDTPSKKKRSVAAALGLAALPLLAAQSADAAQEFGQLAASDSRGGIILTLLVPVLGWVGFNIFGPATRQINAMSADKPAKRK